MRHLLQQALNALVLGSDAAAEELNQFCESMGGRKPSTKALLESQLKEIEDAIIAVKEALAKDEQSTERDAFGLPKAMNCPPMPPVKPLKDEQAPVAWMYESTCGTDFVTRISPPYYAKNIKPLYTTSHSVQRQPLSEEEKLAICEANESHSMYGDFNETDGLGIANAIENAVYKKLGIK